VSGKAATRKRKRIVRANRPCSTCGRDTGSDSYRCARCKTAERLARNREYPPVKRCCMCGKAGAYRCPGCLAWGRQYARVLASLGLGVRADGASLPADEMDRRIEKYRARAQAGQELFCDQDRGRELR
jgi:hypothetical protein